MDFKKQKLQELKSIQQELSNQLELIKQDIQQLEKEVESQNCPVQNSSIKLNKPGLKE